MTPLELLFDLLSPPTCAACDDDLERSAVFCAACAVAFEPAPELRIAGLGVVAAGAYGGPLADALRRFKHAARPDLGRQLGELARRAAIESRVDADLIVPVPLHRRRLVTRGYNQAALLGARLQKPVGARLDTGSLVRIRDTPPQQRIGAAERRLNVVGAFATPHPGRLRGRRVLLVDDVVTTGATLSACAEALLAAGASEVTAVCVARALREEDAAAA